MKLYINILFMLLSCPVLLSCSGDDNGSTSSPYKQYGSRFANMPKKEDAVIYQVNIRSFSNEGTINAIREKLSYIHDLGVNVVYLMPVYPIGQVNMAGAEGSPYAVKDYKAINPDFGTLEDLQALVNEAHDMDMAVILDWVANHTAFDNGWITEHPDWYKKDAQGNIISPVGTNWHDVAQLDYDNTEMRAGMIDAMSYWVYNANIDGFRCDAADFVPQSFWMEAISKVRGIKNQDLLMLAEGTRVNHFAAGFDYTFGFGFFDALKKVYGSGKPATTLQDANAVEYANNYHSDQRIVRYTTNHDVNISDGTPLELFKGANGSVSAFLIASYMKSVPMIYNAQEIGYAQRIDFLDNVPINWSTPNEAMLAEYKKIIAFRNSSDALKRGDYAGYSSNAVAAFTMINSEEKVFVMCNVTNAAVNYIIPVSLAATAWNDAFTNAPAATGSQVTLQPYQYMVLKN
jgi:glycosidase